MDFLDLTLPTPAENLALDELLLLQAEEGTGGEVLRLWELPQHAVVVGSGSRLSEEVHEQNCQADRVPVLRRSSGGGAVVLGPGCLVFSLVLSTEHPILQDVTLSYSYILERVSEAVSRSQPVQRGGCSDLVIGDRKISGNSQRRLRRHLLHHGTLLYDFDLPIISRYLLEPPRQPAYRQRREHGEFVTQVPLPRGHLRMALASAWRVDGETAAWSANRLAQLVVEKYAHPDWIRRR